ncbi:hypothetical protein G9464_10335 [Halostella sp. JP-L12]|uniref:DUF7344 domain-containing protein n=1 Tax=Halostella TaxID=1843185 RepID=UPI000EF7EEF6|nr:MULTISPECIES: hypothetical protein [Halostella]NHN47993.1 hypothetical protein [Halostella sp. JP-L12]
MEEVKVFRVLASADRQIVLHELVRRNQAISVKKLSEQVSSRRYRVDPESISEEEVHRAQIRLVHEHLPLLEEREIIKKSWRDGDVALTEKECVDQLFEVAEELGTWPPDDLLTPSST